MTDSWILKPTDRFILKFIKLHFSSRITPFVHKFFPDLSPCKITFFSVTLGISAGIVFALGHGFYAGVIACLAQIFDGVDGQLARLSKRESAEGAFLDSVLDRYSDGFLVFGMLFYLLNFAWNIENYRYIIFITGTMALIGSSQISYSSERAKSLGISTGRTTLVSKGTRTTIIILFALISPFFKWFPLISLIYLAVHPNIIVFLRIKKAFKFLN